MPSPNPQKPQTFNQARGESQKAVAEKTLGKLGKALSIFSIWGQIRENRALIEKHRDILRPSYNSGMLLVAGVFFMDIVTLVLGIMGIGEFLDTVIDFFEAWVLPIPYNVMGLRFDPVTYLGAGILELIPFINLLPIWTVQAVFTLYSTWLPQIEKAEEEEKQEIESGRQRKIVANAAQEEANEERQEAAAARPAGGAIFTKEGAKGDFLEQQAPAKAPAENPEDLPSSRAPQGAYFRRTEKVPGSSGAPAKVFAEQAEKKKAERGVEFRRNGASQKDEYREAA